MFVKHYLRKVPHAGKGSIVIVIYFSFKKSYYEKTVQILFS